MLYLSIGCALVLIAFVLGWAFIAVDPAKLARFLRWFVVIAASCLALFLVFRGQALLAAAAIRQILRCSLRDPDFMLRPLTTPISVTFQQFTSSI